MSLKDKLNMQETKTKDQLPENFTSIDAAAEFWDTHSLADYWIKHKRSRLKYAPHADNGLHLQEN